MKVLEGLARAGDVELFSFVNPGRTEPLELPAGAPVRRVEVVEAARARLTPFRRARWLLGGRLPLELATRDYRSVRSAFRRWAADRYDLVWFVRAEAFAALGGAVEAPQVVDLDDLEDHKTLARLQASGPGGARGAGARMQGSVNARRWSGLQRRIAAVAERVVVCSGLDRRRLGAPNAVVIPNGYDPPAHPAGRDAIGDPPTILLQGFLLYPANVDAARFLVERVLPLVRQRVPDVGVRLVGKSDGRVERLADPPRVVVTGFVPEIAEELARADAVAVPIRYGSGTRIKILEAFAHRIPVVSTALGVEGVDAVPGAHLLVADDPAEFAEACVTLLTDVDRRHQLVDAAHRLFLGGYRWDTIQDRIAALARDVAG
ncbi:MAG TPA: glycosyltransferase [Actinomycetota bacterium]|nr:glycosyltransferase [Actinomycetota bacterium]